VRGSGGRRAAELLEMDPRTVAQIQRLDQIAMLVYRGPTAGGREGPRRGDA